MCIARVARLARKIRASRTRFDGLGRSPASIYRASPEAAARGALRALILSLSRRGEHALTAQFDQDVVKIGRHESFAEKHLLLDVEGVSRMHAVLTREDAGEWTLIDLGSSTGTRLNGQPTTKARLRPGDVIEIGQLTLRVESVGG